MFDVLGFRRIIGERQLEQLGADYRDLLQLKRITITTRLPRPDAEQLRHISSAVFSDTIAIWASAEPKSVKAFLTTCSTLIAEAVCSGWALRGGIAAGLRIMDREERVFLGQPIVDAYVLEQAQEWVGVGIHPSAVDHPVIGHVVATDGNVRRYAVPTKSCYKSKIEYAINWGNGLPDLDHYLSLLELSAAPDHRHKYDNTRAFLGLSKVQSNYYPM